MEKDCAFTESRKQLREHGIRKMCVDAFFLAKVLRSADPTEFRTNEN